MNKTIKLILFALLSSLNVLAQTTVNDWKLALQKATHDTTRLNCYVQISVCFRPTNIDSTLFYLQKAEILSKSYPNHLYSLEYFLELGNYFTEKGKHLEAESAFKNAKATAKKINYTKDDIYIESRFALNLLGKGEHYKSIKSYLALLTQLKPANATDSALMYRMYHNLAINYIELDDFKKALIYVDKKAAFINIDIERVAFYQQKGLVLMKLKQYPAATTILNKAIALAQKIKSVRFGILATINLAEVARMNNQPKEAVAYNLQTIDLAKKHGFVYEQMVATTNLGATYLDLKEYNKAIGLFKNAIVHFREAKRSYDLSRNLEYIGQAYEALGDYKNAYLNHTSFTKVKEEIVGAEKQKLINELDAQYILAEKQQQIAAQELQNKIQEESIKVEKRQKLLLMTLFGAVLLFLVGTLFGLLKK
jgi:Tetratricopeptide repeat